MIFEHEIPSGSKLYFGHSATLKRKIEDIAAAKLYEAGFEEIMTPLFSYHQEKSIANKKELIRLGDNQNYPMSLRADSTMDVSSLVLKRLGRNTEKRRWFYVQPIYRYPSVETYQIGAESLFEADITTVLQPALDILDALEVSSHLQLSNINIPKLVATLCEVDLDVFIHGRIEELLRLEIPWLKALLYVKDVKHIEEAIAIVPDVIKPELEKLKKAALQLSCEQIVIAPLYYAKMLYYDEIYFRCIVDNEVIARGGRYQSSSSSSVGFAIYTDTLIELLEAKEQNV